MPASGSLPVALLVGDLTLAERYVKRSWISPPGTRWSVNWGRLFEGMLPHSQRGNIGAGLELLPHCVRPRP